MGLIFNFVQSTPALAWTVSHNLGCKPVSDVIVTNAGDQEKILPLSVKHIDDNTLLIEFSVPRSGRARLVGSNPLAVEDAITTPAYRFFRVRINSYTGDAVRFQAMQLLVGGTPWPLTNELPMTSNNTPAPLVASASSVNSTFEPFNAFVNQNGGSDTYRWMHTLNAAAPQYLQLDLGIGNEIVPTYLKLCPDSTAATNYATSISLLASNTGVFGAEAVNLLDSGTLAQANWTANTMKTFTLLPTPWMPE
jgi:hypothetical protein